MLVVSSVQADVIDGTWRFEKAVEYFGLLKDVAPPSEYQTVQIANGKLGLPPRCFVSLRKQEYSFSAAFQSMLKAGIEEKPLADYLQKQLDFTISGVRDSYKMDPDMSDCNNLGQRILVSPNKLIFIDGGAVFYSYARSDGGTAKAISSSVSLYGHKLSHLPFNGDNYMTLCASSIPMAKHIPQTTTKCAPIYYPYAVSKKDTDPLSVLIGTHKYLAGGAKRTNDEDYDDPVSNGRHPVFVLLPPVGDALLVRVDDLETGEDREGIGGAYLAVKGGRVTDQLNVACNWDERHYCSFDKRKPVYQFLESGKFKKLD